MNAPTVDVSVDRRRTAAASAARRRRKTERLALELAPRLADLDDQWLPRLAFAVISELDRRGLEPWRDESE